MHSKVGDVANSVGAEEEKQADVEPVPTQPTRISADHVEQIRKEVMTPSPESEKTDAAPAAETPSAKAPETSGTDQTDQKQEKEAEKERA